MKVKIIKYHPLFAYDVGDIAPLIESDAQRLIESGHAVPVQPEAESATIKAETAAIKRKK
jgi:hypothetical protein